MRDSAEPNTDWLGTPTVDVSPTGSSLISTEQESRRGETGPKLPITHSAITCNEDSFSVVQTTKYDLVQLLGPCRDFIISIKTLLLNLRGI